MMTAVSTLSQPLDSRQYTVSVTRRPKRPTACPVERCDAHRSGGIRSTSDRTLADRCLSSPSGGSNPLQASLVCQSDASCLSVSG